MQEDLSPTEASCAHRPTFELGHQSCEKRQAADKDGFPSTDTPHCEQPKRPLNKADAPWLSLEFQV